MSDLKTIQELILKFAKERDWEQFHTPKNLTLALTGEVGELAEIVQWLSDEQIKNLKGDDKIALEDEVADIFLYLCRLSQVLDIDLIQASLHKIKKNELKYPIEKAKGISTKYRDLK